MLNAMFYQMKNILKKIIKISRNNKLQFNKTFFLMFTTMTVSCFFSQAYFKTVASGSWGTAVGEPGSPWTIHLGSDPDGIPDLNDTVEILNHTIDVLSSSNTTIGALNLTSDGVLNLNSSYSLIFYNFGTTSTFDGTVNNSGQLWFARGTNIEGNGTINSATVRISYDSTFLNSELTFNNLVTISASGIFQITSNGSLTLNGIIKTLGGTQIINEGTIIANNNSFLTASGIPSTASLISSNGNIVWNNSSTFKIPADGSYNDVTIQTSTSCASDFSVKGDFINNATFTSSSTGNTITFDGSSSQSISGSGSCNFKKVLLNNSNGLTLSCNTINIDEVLESTTGAFNQNGSNLTLKSSTADNGALVKVNSQSDYNYTSGNFIVERYFNATSNGWRMISSPVKGSTLADVDDEFIFCGIDDATADNNFVIADCGHFYNVITYNESSDDYSEVTTVNHSIASANGTLIYTSAGEYNLLMGGARSPNFDDISYAVTTNGNGFNLVSNPYPATLDWSAFQSANDIQANNWIFSGDAGNFLSSSNDIPHSQGFFIKANSAGNLNFNVGQTNNSNTATFVKSENGINLPLSLKVSSDQNSYFDYAHIHAAANFSALYDSSFEISKFYTPYPDYAPNIFFLDSDSNDLDRICINNNQDINLFFDVKSGRFAQGNYTVNFENLSKFMIGSCITVEDLHTGQITDLRTDSLFTFNSDTLALSPRFQISIEVDYDIQVVNSGCFQDSSAQIEIFGEDIQGSYFTLIDSVYSIVDSIFTNEHSLVFNNLNAGIYYLSTNHNGRCSIENQQIVVVEPQEVISNFTVPADTLNIGLSAVTVYFNNSSSGAQSYYWDFGDGGFSNLINPSHSYLSQGIYDVVLTAYSDTNSNCYDTFSRTLIINNNQITDIVDFSTNHTYSYFSDNILITNTKVNFENIKIYDLSGRKLISTQFKKELPINLIDGIYIVSLSNGNDTYIQKVHLSKAN